METISEEDSERASQTTTYFSTIDFKYAHSQLKLILKQPTTAILD